MFIPSVIKQINYYTVTIANGANSGSTALAHSESTSYTLLSHNGQTVHDGVNPGYSVGNARAIVTFSGSNIVALRGWTTGVATVLVCATEFYPGFFRQAIQYAHPGLNGLTSIDATITAVTKGQVIQLGEYVTSGEDITQNQYAEVNAYLLDATHVRFSRTGSGTYNWDSYVAVLDWR